MEFTFSREGRLEREVKREDPSSSVFFFFFFMKVNYRNLILLRGMNVCSRIACSV